MLDAVVTSFSIVDLVIRLAKSSLSCSRRVFLSVDNVHDLDMGVDDLANIVVTMILKTGISFSVMGLDNDSVAVLSASVIIVYVWTSILTYYIQRRMMQKDWEPYLIGKLVNGHVPRIMS